MKNARILVAGSERLALHAARDLAALTRPRIAVLVAFSAFVGGLLGAGPAASLWRVAEAALWVACAGASASVLNQVLERDVDRLMKRTENRPLPAGRVCLRGAGLLRAGLA